MNAIDTRSENKYINCTQYKSLKSKSLKFETENKKKKKKNLCALRGSESMLHKIIILLFPESHLLHIIFSYL